MASFICWIRGDKRAVERFISDLIAIYLPFKYKNHDGKDFVDGTKENWLWPISIRYLPLGAWEIVFPREHKDIVLTTILGRDKPTKMLSKFCKMIRLAMKLQKIPEFNKEKAYPIYRKGVQIIPIGFKEDVIKPGGLENL